jgi:UDP-glucose 4-epimerase
MTITLVTGGAGFIGSHVIEELLKNPLQHIISLDNYFTGNTANHINDRRVEYRRGHTLQVKELVPEPVDTIYHLGEYARIAPSYREPELVYDLNTIGTRAIINFWKEQRSKLVYAASSTYFSTDRSPYAVSKAANVRRIRDEGRWFKLPYAICYFYNAFGPREIGGGKYATLIAKYIHLYNLGRPLPIVLPGTQERNFTYVKDLAHGMVMVGSDGNGDLYALNNPNAYSVEEIARVFKTNVVYKKGHPGRKDSGEIPDRAVIEYEFQTTLNVKEYIYQQIKNSVRYKGIEAG